MNAITYIERSLNENFTSEWFQIAIKAPEKSCLQIYWQNANEAPQGEFKVYASINAQAMSLISNVAIYTASNIDNAVSIIIDAPYQFLRFKYQKSSETSSGLISIICSAQL